MVGNRSPWTRRSWKSIRRFVEREDPGALVAPLVFTGFSDSHWWQRAFPECVACSFFPVNAMDLVESYPLMHGVDERIAVADLGLAAAFYADLMLEMLR